MHLPSCLLQLNLTSWQWWLKKLYSLILFPLSEVNNFQISGQSFPWYLGRPLTILNPLFQSLHRSLYLKIIANWKLKDMFICDINRAPKGEPDAQMSSFSFCVPVTTEIEKTREKWRWRLCFVKWAHLKRTFVFSPSNWHWKSVWVFLSPASLLKTSFPGEAALGFGFST